MSKLPELLAHFRSSALFGTPIFPLGATFRAPAEWAATLLRRSSIPTSCITRFVIFWFSGTAVWAVGADGKLYHNWVERCSYELFQQLSDSQGKSI